MTEYAHAHPMPDGRRFEHVHRVDEVPLADHAALPLAEAHPELAEVARAPVPGSPADLHQQALYAREQAAWHRARANEYERQAAELERRAAQDEQEPPSEAERIRRLLEGGLG